MNRPIGIPVVTAGGADAQPSAAPGPRPVAGVDAIVLVTSGKGGVGKSTLAVNLACALAQRGHRVGLADADLNGPSVARMLGTGSELPRDGDGRAVPASSFGVASVSVANLLPPEAGIVWKGPLVAQAVLQLFHEVAWPALDVLLVDTPPGSGDVALTLLEQLPVTGAVVVTTPQRLAVIDAERGIGMCHQRDIPVFGLVENMDGYVCPCCGETQALFPGGAARALAAKRHVAHLGGVPLDPGAQARADAGLPLVAIDPDGAAARAIARVAGALEGALEREREDRRREADEVAGERHREFWERLLDEG